LFKNLFKVVGITSRDPGPVDDKQRIKVRLRQFEFQKFNEIDEITRLVRFTLEFLCTECLEGFFERKMAEENCRGIPAGRDERFRSAEIILCLPEPFSGINRHGVIHFSLSIVSHGP
jgi:hypothetical protein